MDLNELLNQAVTGWATAGRVDLVTSPASLAQVVSGSGANTESGRLILVLNAKEAVARQRVRDARRDDPANGWVVLAVTTTVRHDARNSQHRSLFRPFQTTKKKGLGIGMFQSKMIVEAHGGGWRSKVELGKGTDVSRIVAVQRPGE